MPKDGLLREPCALTHVEAAQTHTPQRKVWQFLNLQVAKSSTSLSPEGKITQQQILKDGVGFLPPAALAENGN